MSCCSVIFSISSVCPFFRCLSQLVWYRNLVLGFFSSGKISGNRQRKTLIVDCTGLDLCVQSTMFFLFVFLRFPDILPLTKKVRDQNLMPFKLALSWNKVCFHEEDPYFFFHLFIRFCLFVCLFFRFDHGTPSSQLFCTYLTVKCSCGILCRCVDDCCWLVLGWCFFDRRVRFRNGGRGARRPRSNRFCVARLSWDAAHFARFPWEAVSSAVADRHVDFCFHSFSLFAQSGILRNSVLYFYLVVSLKKWFIVHRFVFLFFLPCCRLLPLSPPSTTSCRPPPEILRRDKEESPVL